MDEYSENQLVPEDMDKRRIGGSKARVHPVDLVIGQYCKYTPRD